MHFFRLFAILYFNYASLKFSHLLYPYNFYMYIHTQNERIEAQQLYRQCLDVFTVLNEYNLFHLINVS